MGMMASITVHNGKKLATQSETLNNKKGQRLAVKATFFTQYISYSNPKEEKSKEYTQKTFILAPWKSQAALFTDLYLLIFLN